MQKIIPFYTRSVSTSEKHHTKGPMFTMDKVPIDIDRTMPIREHRKLTGLSIQEAAYLVGISKSDLINFEVDSRDVPCSVALKICRVYGIATIDQFYVGVDPRAFENRLRTV